MPVKGYQQNGKSGRLRPLWETGPGAGENGGSLWQADPVDTAPDLRFAIALFGAAAGTGDSNYVCSPWSVASALAALAPGTTADARDEIAAAVGSPDRLRHEAALVAGSPGGGDAVLEVANRLWVDEGRVPNSSFLAEFELWPGAGVRTAPIRRDPEGARALVNADVAATTRGLIPEIIGQGTLHGMTAVLVNALYLLAGWLQPFRPGDTAEEAFHAPGGTRNVATMRASHETVYARTASWQYVSLPLALGMQAEVVLPPDHPREPLAGRRLTALREAATPYRVDLHLPRARLEAGTRLAGPLAALGVCRIFDSAAPAVTGAADQPLFISDALHRTVLRVDESGIEGAAATGMVMRAVAFRSLPEVEVVVDRPFYLLVGHRATGAVLFMARVADP
jgi:serine protease inhibitor